MDIKFRYKPTSNLERFGYNVYLTLVENFPQTFFVGGMVRDLLLDRNVIDIDIATEALPYEVANFLGRDLLQFDDAYRKFGAIIAKQGIYSIEITTFRKDLRSENRYPRVSFVKNPKIDSNRRDFTVNALYLSAKQGSILDFHHGLKDLKNRLIRFIGDPDKRIKEDPLRILRALRFALTLNFKLEKNTLRSVKNNFGLLRTLTESRKQKEADKVRIQKQKSLLNKILFDKNLLDKYFK